VPSETALLLPAEALAAVRALLRRHVPRAEVWAYGSRVDGRAHPGSDLDLVVRDPEDLSRLQEGLDALKAAFSESNLPFLVDVLDWARIPDSFRREIERAHVVIQGGVEAGRSAGGWVATVSDGRRRTP
jgi:predicted nucleotidyltransferase